MNVPVVSVVAEKSGTGKTTLLEKMIPQFKKRGYRVGVVKHDAHRFDIDREGKDSWRLTQAGADTMIISSPVKLAMVKQHPDGLEPALPDIIGAYYGDVDIVLTEGFKKNAYPKIEVHRKEHNPALLCRGRRYDPMLLAVASDTHLVLDVPVFDIDDALGLVLLVEKRFLADGASNKSG